MENANDASLWWSCRLSLALCCFLGSTLLMLLRICLSFAITCMVHQKGSPSAFNGTAGHSIIRRSLDFSFCHGMDLESEEEFLDYGQPEFDWSASLQGLILSGYFQGYLFTQIFGGWLTDRFGAKKMFISGMFLVSSLSLTIPEVARLSPEAFYVVRMLQGMSNGLALPAVHALFSVWSTNWDRGFLMSVAYVGFPVGAAVAFPLSGFLCKHGFSGGWPSVFYVPGMLGIVWSAAAYFIIYRSPQEHPRISPSEREYLLQNLPPQQKKRRTSVPWRKLLMSLPLSAISVSHFCMNWGFYTFALYLPQFMKQSLSFDVKKLLTGKIFDRLRKANLLTLTNQRKIFNSIGFFLPCVFLSLVFLVSCENRYAIAVLLALSQGSQTVAFAGGFMYNHVDIAPQHAGILLGITNTLSNVPGFVIPVVVPFLIEGFEHGWSYTFYLTMAMYVIGGGYYILFGSSEIQPWAKTEGDPLLISKAGEAQES